MTLFSSGKHAKLTTDRAPWICPGADERYRMNDLERLECDEYRPRPEFDLPLANPANPILDHYRRRESTWPIDGYLRSLIPANSWQWESIATADQMKHALNVLSRLAILRTTP